MQGTLSHPLASVFYSSHSCTTTPVRTHPSSTDTAAASTCVLHCFCRLRTETEEPAGCNFPALPSADSSLAMGAATASACLEAQSVLPQLLHTADPPTDHLHRMIFPVGGQNSSRQLMAKRMYDLRSTSTWSIKSESVTSKAQRLMNWHGKMPT